MSALVDRLRSLPADFAAAYREREAELRAALLPDDHAVADARAVVSTRRGARLAAAPLPAQGADDAPTDDAPY